MTTRTILLDSSLHSHDFNMTSRRLDSKGYFNIGKYKEHRIIWQEYHKASLLSWGHIHHKNGIRTDNRIENLEAMTIRQHSRIHFNPANTKGLHYHWKATAIGRTKSIEHKKRIGDGNRDKRKPIRSAEHCEKHNESLKRMYTDRKAKGWRWTGRKWIKGDDAA